MKWWPAAVKSGDMVRVRIGGIWHYGVYVSDSEVIQFGAPPRQGAEKPDDILVCATSMEVFSGGSIVETAKLGLIERMKRIPPGRTVRIARSRIGEGGYNLLHNNCEHFAYECVFGVKRSEQEEAARRQWNEHLKAEKRRGNK